MTYEWDVVGNLKSRWNQSSNVGRTARKNLQESFCYDGLNRLIKSHQGTLTGSCSLAASAQDIEYDGLGNITRKVGVGAFTYSGKGPHAVTTAGSSTYGYDNNGNQTAGGGRNVVAYDTSDQPTYIGAGSTTTQFKYGPDNARWERVSNKNGVNTITHYLGNVERIEVQNSGIVEWKRYIAGAIYTVRTTVTAAAGGVTYAIQRTDKSFIYNDHLGSLDVVVNNVGQITHTAGFDAWGNRRSGENWTAAFAASTLSLTNYTQPITQRGFTGHEMLDDTGLIHMNGRVYDPKLSRFLQADPFIQAASNTQSYNRYSYTLNNPLNATDPSGYFWGHVIAAVAAWAVGDYARRNDIGWLSDLASIVGCYYGYCVASAFGATYGQTQNFYSAALAGMSAVAFQGAGLAAAGNPAGAFLASGVVGGVVSSMQGGEFGHGFISAGLGGAAGAKFGYSWEGMIASAVIGGTASEMTGGKFKNGAASAAFTYAAQWGMQKHKAGGGAGDGENEAAIKKQAERAKIEGLMRSTDPADRQKAIDLAIDHFGIQVDKRLTGGVVYDGDGYGLFNEKTLTVGVGAENFKYANAGDLGATIWHEAQHASDFFHGGNFSYTYHAAIYEGALNLEGHFQYSMEYKGWLQTNAASYSSGAQTFEPDLYESYKSGNYGLNYWEK